MTTMIEWALVADSGRARIFERQAPAGQWRERTADAVTVANPPSHEQGRDRPGRVHESATPARHGVEARTDRHRAAKAAFAGQIAARLEAAAAQYQRLVLVAPPPFLGDLRAALGKGARARLHGTLDRDLAHQSLSEIAPRLDAVTRP